MKCYKCGSNRPHYEMYKRGYNDFCYICFVDMLKEEAAELRKENRELKRREWKHSFARRRENCFSLED